MDGQNGGNEPVNPSNNGVGGAMLPDDASLMGGGAIYSDPNLTIEKDAIPEAVNNAPSGAETGVVFVADPSNDTINTASTANVASTANINGTDNNVNTVGAGTMGDAGNAGRVATAFANTDASKNAMMAPGMATGSAITQSTATGDIKLSPTRRPMNGRSKLPLIIGGIVIAAMLIAVVTLLVMRGKGGGSVTETFNEYYDYSQKLFAPADDEGETDNGDDWRSEEELEQIRQQEAAEAENDTSEIFVEDEEDDGDYTDEENENAEGEGVEAEDPELSPETIVELRAKFDKFKQAADVSKSSKVNDIRGKIDTLDKYLGLMERAISIDKVSDEVLGTYVNHGEDATRELLNNMRLADQEDMLYTISDMQVDYYSDMVGVYVENERIGCAKDGEIDPDCAARYYGDDGFQFNVADSDLAEMRTRITNPSTVNVISKEILALNQEIKTELEK